MLENKKDRLQARRALRSLMSDISEDVYFAGWLIDLEFDLWDFVTGVKQPDDDRVDTNRLRSLSEDCGGWFVFHHYETFVPMHVWLRLYSIGRGEKYEKKLAEYVDNLHHNKKEKERENGKWYRRRNKTGPKYRQRLDRYYRRKKDVFVKLGEAMAVPLRRMLDYQSIGRQLFNIEPLPPMKEGLTDGQIEVTNTQR